MFSKKVNLACQDCKSKNYVKPKSKTDKRLVVKKYCKRCRSSTVHKEER